MEEIKLLSNQELLGTYHDLIKNNDNIQLNEYIQLLGNLTSEILRRMEE